MKKLFLFVLGFIATSGCATDLRYFFDTDTARKEFVYLLKEGFSNDAYNGNKRYVFGLAHNRVSCVYGSTPNAVAKEQIDKLYKLFRNEFHIYDRLDYVQEFTSCPADTSVYIHLHESRNREALWNDLSHVLSYRGVTRKESLVYFKRQVDPIAFAISTISDVDRRDEERIIDSRGENKLFFVSIDQNSKNVMKSILMQDYLKMVITEELYQTFTAGKDLHKLNSKSILEGLTIPLSQRQYFKLINHDQKMVRRFINANANGMCTYDLWFLILARGFDQTLFSLDDYKKRFYKKYKEVKERANKIINNPEYDGLFDSRCTGNNDGFSTSLPQKIEDPDLSDEFKKLIPANLKGGLDRVDLTRRSDNLAPWRDFKLYSHESDKPPTVIKTIRVTTQEYYRAMYAFPNTNDFAVTHISQSQQGQYKQDKENITEAMTHNYNRKRTLIDNHPFDSSNPHNIIVTDKAKAKGKDYISFESKTLNGYEYISLTENVLGLNDADGNTISKFHIFVPEHDAILTTHLLGEGETKFRNIEEFLQLRSDFISSYTHFLSINKKYAM